jgi:MFS family permease
VSVLRARGLVPLVTAEAVSALGSQMTFLALPWFVLVTTGSAARMSLVLAVQLAPVALLGIPSGALIARLGARRTLILGDAARAPLMASIPLLHGLGVLTFPLLLVLVACIGCFLAPYFSAQRLILPELLGEDERTVGVGNALLEGIPRLMGLLGPAAAGVLIAVLDAPSVLYVDAATFVFSALVLTFLVPARPPAEPTDEARGLFAGVRFLLHDRLLGPLAGCAMALNALGQMLVAALPVLAYEQYDGSSRVAGAFFASFGAGAIVGMVAALRLMPRYDPIRLAAVSLVALTLPIWLLLAHLPAWGIVGALIVSALFGPLVNAPMLGVITTRPPAALRPKVMTAVITFAMLAGPVGLLVAGPLLQQIGARPVFGVVAAGELVAALVFAFVALRHREPPLEIGEPAVQPG